MDLLGQILSILTFVFSIVPTPTFTPIITPKLITPISLNRIFDNRLEVLKGSENNSVTLITTGDVIPARTVNFKMVEKNDFSYPFSLTAGYLRNADLTLINLEAPLIENCPVTTEGMIFCGDQRFVAGMLSAGIDAATLGNNHALNYGREGLIQTAALLHKNNILYSGIPEDSLSNLAVSEVKGLSFGFLSYNILDNPDQNKILTEISEAAGKVDFLVVSYHWGAEYTARPAEETINLARQTIDAGADLVAGNHPHWIQPIEVYKDKLIIYAHGNFIFDQEWSEETKTGIIVKTVIYGKKIIDAEVIPVYIRNYSTPEFLTGQKKEEVLKLVREISMKF